MNAPSRPQGGYVLLLTLGGLLLLAVLAARLDVTANAVREAVQTRLDLHAQQAEVQGVLDRVLWHLVTRQLERQGFGQGTDRLWIDGRVTNAGDGWWLSLQEARGLLNLNFADTTQLRRLLLETGVPSEQVEDWLDALGDYADLDDLRRLHGAEAAEYANLGLPPPRNDWLMSPHELVNLPGWRDDPERTAAVIDLTTTHSDGWVNINAAPAAVLQTLPGATLEGVTRLLERRETLPYLDTEVLGAETGVRLVSDDPIQFFPGLFYRLRLWRELGYAAWEFIVMLTPNYPDRPYQILDVRRIPRPAAPPVPEEAPRLPPPQMEAAFDAPAL